MSEIKVTEKEEVTILTTLEKIEKKENQINKLKAEVKELKGNLSPISERKFINNDFDFLSKVITLSDKKVSFGRGMSKSPTTKQAKNFPSYIKEKRKPNNIWNRAQIELVTDLDLIEEVNYWIKSQ